MTPLNDYDEVAERMLAGCRASGTRVPLVEGQAMASIAVQRPCGVLVRGVRAATSRRCR